jgi:hypothetical protein
MNLGNTCALPPLLHQSKLPNRFLHQVPLPRVTTQSTALPVVPLALPVVPLVPPVVTYQQRTGNPRQRLRPFQQRLPLLAPPPLTTAATLAGASKIIKTANKINATAAATLDSHDTSLRCRASPTCGVAAALKTVHLVTAIESFCPYANIVIDLATGASQEYEHLHNQCLEDL